MFKVLLQICITIGCIGSDADNGKDVQGYYFIPEDFGYETGFTATQRQEYSERLREDKDCAERSCNRSRKRIPELRIRPYVGEGVRKSTDFN